ncbi:MAG: SUF system NifU family Fe-S cluster assembly protein [Thermoanaerobaculaceae bacterium]|nr:SUF system NifU family Fe-S cluster assembly protein [Thermoanaerobaculaceae bacterium]MDI9621465.1 SUF system NifU family Fe-S cluster assembly protein [Acidobacteriota bacterium]NLH11113.1 SUF system NifU family Fe-S cluster assembly protein [Holophagae bacterium]HPW54247.1 SUF system NifU family Fe-S cluster assembly protein [Thermoanaerobaculaceae bacterium]
MSADDPRSPSPRLAGSGFRFASEQSGAPLDDLYREVVLDHQRHPRGREPLARVDASAHGFNPVCGDEVEVRLALDAESVAGVQVTGRGCAICTASGSMLAELVPGLDVAEVFRLIEGFRDLLRGNEVPPELDLGDLAGLGGVARFPVRVKCAMLPWVTLEDAVRSHAIGHAAGVARAGKEEP